MTLLHIHLIQDAIKPLFCAHMVRSSCLLYANCYATPRILYVTDSVELQWPFEINGS